MAVPVRRTFAALCTGGAGGVVNEARWSYPPDRGDNDDGDEDDIPNPIFQDGSRSNCCIGKKGKGDAKRREGGREVEARLVLVVRLAIRRWPVCPNLIWTGPDDDDQLSYSYRSTNPEGRRDGVCGSAVTMSVEIVGHESEN